MQPTSVIYTNFPKSKQLDVILPGQHNGITSDRTQRLVEASKDQGISVLSFSYPHHERGDTKYSENLQDELELLKYYLNVFKTDRYGHIRLIGKSLGGMLASKYLSQVTDMQRYSIVILGYIIGEEEIHNFTGDVTIIQGEKDEYGNIDQIKSDMKSAQAAHVRYEEIKGADHSYRGETDEDDHLEEVVAIIYDK